jgi:DNA repair exonuclease SbcCD ATPase subunit
VEGICQKAKGVDDARADVQAAAHLKGKRDNLEALDMAHRKYRDWSMRAEQLKAAQDKAGARRDQMAEKTRISDVDRAVSESLESLRQDYSTANDRNQEIQKANESLRTKIETARRELETLNARKADIEKRLSGKPETPGGSDVCAACPLLSEYRDLPERAAELAAQIVKVAKAVEALEAEPREEAADLTDLVRRGEAGRAARERVEAAEGHAAEFERAQTDLDNASMALRAELSTVRRELDALSGAEERLRAAEEASVALEDAEKRLVECEARGCEASAVAVGLEAEADSARRALEEKDAATKGLREKISSAEAEASRLDSLVSDIAGRVGSLESTIRHLGETIEQHRAKAEEAATLRGRETACRFLRQAFGPKGIQALLVDQHAAPALEEIADKIFQTASDGQMRLRIVTQERDSKGGMKEAFSILVSGVDGARDFADIRKYSGGEQSMIRFVFRVALLIFVMQKTGRDLSILMLDEPLEGMSDNWRRAALATIREYLPQFSQVIVVTHDASFSANCDHRITVEKTPLGARISGGATTQESPVLVGA